MEFHLSLPQMRMTFAQLVERARAAEAAGFAGITGMDHFAPPEALDQPMFEAQVTSTWLAAHTERLTIGSLVLCDTFRHPCLLAKESVSIDHASGGRYELGLGWGSRTGEFSIFGVEPSGARDRVERMRETLEIVRALWDGETVTYQGRWFSLDNAFQSPTPLDRIPIIIGGSGPRTMAMVAAFADWWNIPVGTLDTFERARDQAGGARVSMQHMVALVPPGGDRDAIAAQARRRYGHWDPAIGTGAELVDFVGRLGERGVERLYAWFCDFAPPDTLAAFGEEVIAELA